MLVTTMGHARRKGAPRWAASPTAHRGNGRDDPFSSRPAEKFVTWVSASRSGHRRSPARLCSGGEGFRRQQCQRRREPLNVRDPGINHDAPGASAISACWSQAQGVTTAALLFAW